eukprot:scaffold1746_cov46-Phaeocystis_antarctica.AAC.1
MPLASAWSLISCSVKPTAPSSIASIRPSARACGAQGWRPGCVGLQPGCMGVAAWVRRGCSLGAQGVQPGCAG